MLFERNRPIQQRLILAFGLFAALLLLLIWLINLAYFFANERKELLRTLQTQAAMLATQSSAAIVFEDQTTLAENLAALKHMDNLKWAIILVPADATHPADRLLAQHGSPPDSVERHLAELARHDGVLAGLDETIVSQAIMHNGLLRGHVVIAIDQRNDTAKFLYLALVSLLLNLAFLMFALVVFHRIVASITQPIRQLAQIADLTSQTGIPQDRAESYHDDEIGQLGKSFNHMLDNLTIRERQLAYSRDDLRALSQRLLDIREEERTRIAHEIHDVLGQQLTAIKFELANNFPAASRRHLTAAVDAAIQMARDISWDLRPNLLDSLGLSAAIEWLAQDFTRRVGIRCCLRLAAGLPELGPAQATDIFRICQELLTNISRHARASRADIALSADGDLIRLEVSDNGIGIPVRPPQHRSLGLIGLQERVRRWHGRIDIVTRPTADGTMTCIVMPISHSPPPQESIS